MTEYPKTVYLCGVDWQHHIELDPAGTKSYPSIEALKVARPCWPQCGIVRVSMERPIWVVQQDFDKDLNLHPQPIPWPLACERETEPCRLHPEQQPCPACWACFQLEDARDEATRLKRQVDRMRADLVKRWTRWLEDVFGSAEGIEDLEYIFATNPELLARAKRIFGVS